jgi:hypothetical protein
MSQTIQKRQDTNLTGSFGDSKRATEAMLMASESMHLVSPATSVGELPAGCVVALSQVHVSPLDTYPLQGKHGLSKTVIQKIGHAAGVSWDPHHSGRLDDGSNPYYVRWRAVGTYRAFDGQQQTLVAEKELDLRPGSPTCVGLEQQQAAKQKSADGQIREMRMHIQQHAETKAQLRALRSLGLKSAYTADELKKPFAVARIMFTGQTSDPGLRAMFAEKIADSFLGSQRALYGGAPQSAAPRLVAPPPVGSASESGDWDIDTGERLDATPQTQQAEPAREQPAQQPADTKVESKAEAKPAQVGAQPDLVLKFSRSKGKTIAQADTKDLEWIRDTVGNSLETGDSRYPESDKKMLAAVTAELTARGDF